MFKNYPEYAGAPYEMMTWLFVSAKNIEDMENDAYGPVGHGNDDDEQELTKNKYDRGFGPKNAAERKKAEAAKKKRLEEMKQKQLEELKNMKKTADKSDAVKEEAKVVKKFKEQAIDVQKIETVDVDTTREPCSIVFIGHVDHGKSTISGNLMYLMGVVDQRTIDKYKQEAKDKGRDSWWLAYVMDVSDEEKAKGKTIEVGRAQFDTKTKKYTIFDAPGHKNYVPNMIMGAALADFGGLVISARKGEFEAGFENDGQTREHAQLAQSLGIQKLLVIVNKMDECKWSEARYKEI